MYGVTTGFGKLSEVAIPPERLAELQVNLVRSHASGVGDRCPRGNARNDAAARERAREGVFGSAARASRAAGRNAQRRTVAADPGAGQRRRERRSRAARASGARADRRRRAARERREAAMPPRCCAAWTRANRARAQGRASRSSTARRRTPRSRRSPCVDARRLWRTAHIAGAMSLEALLGTPVAFDARIHEARGQVGQQRSAALLRDLLADSEIRESHRHGDPRVQDAYALRCMPQVHGPVPTRSTSPSRSSARELNAATDNPLVFENGEMLSGGNFHGQAVAMALDVLAIALTNLATMSERRIDRLVHPDLNQGLPPFLTRGRRRELGLHDGAGDGGVAGERVQGALASGERRHDSHRRQQGGRRADGDGRGVEAAARGAQRAERAGDRADVRGAGRGVPRAAARRRAASGKRTRSCASWSRRSSRIACSRRTSARSPLPSRDGRFTDVAMATA